MQQYAPSVFSSTLHIGFAPDSEIVFTAMQVGGDLHTQLIDGLYVEVFSKTRQLRRLRVVSASNRINTEIDNPSDRQHA